MLDNAGYAELVETQPTLYHRVWDPDDHGRLASVLEHGLERFYHRYDGFWRSRQGHVFLGRRDAVLKIRPPEDMGVPRPWALVAVDASVLERKRINPDEDQFLTDARRGEKACRAFGVPFPPSQWLWEWARYLSLPCPSLGEWAEQVDLGARPDQTIYSMRQGTLAYAGVVPSTALRVHSRGVWQP